MGNVIFVIEDDANILSALEAKFGMLGSKIASCNGSEDIQVITNKIKESLSEYIILDIILPNIDGFKILQTIKADEELSSITVFIFSKFSEEDLKTRCENLGAEYYLIKEEFSIDGLVNKVNRIIYNRESVVDYFK